MIIELYYAARYKFHICMYVCTVLGSKPGSSVLLQISIPRV